MKDTQIESWREEFDKKFGTIRHRGFPQTAIKSFIENLLTQAREDAANNGGGGGGLTIGEETAKNREWFEKGQKQERERIKKVVEEFKVSKEATKINATGLDFIFVYDLLKELES